MLLSLVTNHQPSELVLPAKCSLDRETFFVVFLIVETGTTSFWILSVANILGNIGFHPSILNQLAVLF
ncbi:MAG: hypothetical protein ABIE14_05385 [Patescibacteria group bacterium]